VQTNSDYQREGDETFTVVLSQPTGVASIRSDSGEATGTIIDIPPQPEQPAPANPTLTIQSAPEQPSADLVVEASVEPAPEQQADEPPAMPENELVVLRDFPEQRFSAGDGFTTISYQIPTDTFGHTETEAEITLSALLADGQDLPKWLIFDPEKGEFRGIPPKGFSGTLMIRVVARNDIGDQVETMVTIDILSNDQTSIQNGKSDLFVQLQSDSQFSWRAARDQLVQAAKRMRG
jgi:predicted ester cyclase